MGGRMASLGLDNLTTRVAVPALLEKLKQNRASHKDAYDAAVKGYKQHVLRELKETFNACQAVYEDHPDAPVKPVRVVLDPPKHFLDAYDTAIEAFTWTKNTEVALELHQFRQLVQDQWDWKDEFLASTSRYAAFGG